jgi:tether containing UBX domain for GLUT4
MHRTAKIKCEPSTLLREVRARACAVFALPDPADFSLKHKANELDLSLPVRLTSLIQNAKLELVAATARAKRRDAGPAEVAIRLRVEDLAPHFSDKLVAPFPAASTTLWQVLTYFERVSGINFTKRVYTKNLSGSSGVLMFEMPIVQAFSRRFSKIEEFSGSLVELGLSNKQETLRVRFEKTEIMFHDAIELQNKLFEEVSDTTEAVPKETAPHSTPANEIAPEPSPVLNQVNQLPKKPIEPTPAGANGAPATLQSAEPAQLDSVVPTDRKVQVYLPSAAPRVIADDDDSAYVVSVAQIQRLHDQIQKVSAPKDGPLLTKALREKQAQEKQQRQVSSIQIRIRLPDQTNLEAEFAPTETVAAVAAFVRSVLNRPDLPFNLFISPPKSILAESTAELGRDLRLARRTLLFLEWRYGAGYTAADFPTTGVLRPEYAQAAKAITEAPDVKLDTARAVAESETNPANAKSATVEHGKSSGGASWLSKGKGPLSAHQKSKLMKFIKTSK